MNIYEKMLAITSELEAVAKNLIVGEGKNQYKATGEADVLAAVKPLEEKHRVYSYPYSRKIVDTNTMTTTSTYGNSTKEITKLFLRLETVYRFVNVDEPTEYIDITTYGDGVDTQDKATGKAMTYADKYALLKAYKIITGDDSDQKPSEEGSFGKELATDLEKNIITDRCKQLDVSLQWLLKQVGVTDKMTKEQHGKALIILKEIEEGRAE